MAENVFFFDYEGDTRKVTCGEGEIGSLQDLAQLLKIKYSDIEIDTDDVKFWTKDQEYKVRHRIESPEDIYRGAVLEVTFGPVQKRKREEDKQESSCKRSRVTGPRFVLRLRGLPWQTNLTELKEFFKGIELTEAKILYWPDGRATGEALAEFMNEEELEKGLLKNKENIGTRYIEVFKATGEEMDRALGVGGTEGIKDIKNKVLRMRGLPYSATEKDVLQFFEEGNLTPARVHILTDKGTGRASGVALVEFENEDEIVAALDLNRNEIGDRYIELFRGSMEELRGALGLESGGGFNGGTGGQGGGGYGDCVRMRGLPFNSSENDIINFFQEVNVGPVRIHRKSDGSEAFVEFRDGDITRAMKRHKGYMGHRYIELFRITHNEVADIVGLPGRTRSRSAFFW